MACISPNLISLLSTSFCILILLSFFLFFCNCKLYICWTELFFGSDMVLYEDLQIPLFSKGIPKCLSLPLSFVPSIFHPSIKYSDLSCHKFKSAKCKCYLNQKSFFFPSFSLSLFLSLCEFSLNPSPCLFSLSLSLSFPLSLSLLGSLSLFLSTVVYSMRPLFRCTHGKRSFFW